MVTLFLLSAAFLLFRLASAIFMSIITTCVIDVVSALACTAIIVNVSLVVMVYFLSVTNLVMTFNIIIHATIIVALVF